MKEFLVWLGVARRPYQPVKVNVKFKTTFPLNQPPYYEWVKEFRVSMLYDRTIVHM